MLSLFICHVDIGLYFTLA